MSSSEEAARELEGAGRLSVPCLAFSFVTKPPRASSASAASLVRGASAARAGASAQARPGCSECSEYSSSYERFIERKKKRFI